MGCWRVTQLNNYIKQVFEAEEMLHNVEVVGEIDGIGIKGSAAFFTIKDENASIQCSCYVPAKLKDIKNGSQVVVRGSVSYWNKVGKICFVVNKIEVSGFGAMFLKFQELQNKLRAEGLFNAGVKKEIPKIVKRVGVVTSRSGAVIHDIVNVARRRNSAVDIVLYPSAVQGAGAVNEICQGIDYFSRSKSVDVVIVARGGGSREDLIAFDSEQIARAVFASAVPIVSAVGHESDFTLCDFVADLRAPTPSAAAELCVAARIGRVEAVKSAWARARFAMRSKIENFETQVKTNFSKSKSAINLKLHEFEGRVEGLASIVEERNPIAVLRRGFAKVSKNGSDILSAKELKKSDEIKIRFSDGVVDAEVR
jgi:exodeoxyribonuclease VII large subunit